MENPEEKKCTTDGLQNKRVTGTEKATSADDRKYKTRVSGVKIKATKSTAGRSLWQ